MFQLFLRTVSQGLQAFVPVAAAWIWFRRSDPRIASPIGTGMRIAIPVTILAARDFAATNQKALYESMLAAAALVAALAFLWSVWGSRGGMARQSAGGRLTSFLIAAATVLVIVRQSMEIGATFSAAFFEMRSFDATRAVVFGTLVAGAAAAGWVAAGIRLSAAKLSSATRAFAVLFVVQVLVYGLHEASEARLLPFSETLHEASEPYGPDGVYGMHFSDLLLIGPMAAAMATRVPVARLAVLLVPVALAGLHPIAGRTVLHAAGADPAPVMRQPFVLFRDTTTGATFGQASVLPLGAPDGARTAAGLSCERVSFAPVLGTGSRGICLHAAGTFFNLFTGYSAIFMDGSLGDRGLTMKLEGKPSRTRVSPDGKLGALTVFVFGDGYSSADFSTRTLLLDMATGARIADLEEFTTFRDGQKIGAKDFNFWGVTFARDGDTFYASLRTAGKTYLVRGSVAKRSFAVLRENVECPSLSPDGRRLAFKKFIGPDPGAWRIATLELATMHERLVEGETRYVDDQMEWLDADRILYAVPRRTTASSDVWVVPVDGSTPAKVFIPLAESPSVVR
ncbi:MAG: hypothetical protein AB7O32_02165 [Vicinamibacterales bacterium]